MCMYDARVFLAADSRPALSASTPTHLQAIHPTHTHTASERSKKRYRNSRVVPGPSGRIPDVASQLTTLLERAEQSKEGREGGRVRESRNQSSLLRNRRLFLLFHRDGAIHCSISRCIFCCCLLLLRGEGKAGLPAYTYRPALTIKDNPINPTHGFPRP